VAWHSFKDHVIFERQEVLTLAGKPYTVFTPYKNAWLKKVDDFYLKPYPLTATRRRWRPCLDEKRAVPRWAGSGLKRPTCRH
jgi:deoxyribodipyrimidine photo-lyase